MRCFRSLNFCSFLFLAFVIVLIVFKFEDIIVFLVKDEQYEWLKTNLTCPSDCNVCEKMPYSRRAREMQVHHLNTGLGLWNEEERFKNLQLTQDSLIIYVGANTEGRDGKALMKMANCSIHIFEPVPSFFVQLEKNWKKTINQHGYKAVLHNEGLGKSDRIVKLSVDEIDGQSTFGMKSSSSIKDDGMESLVIKEASESLKNIMKSSGKENIDLLHVNCEGCEWEMLENIIENKIHLKIRSINVGTHYFPAVPDIWNRFCKIREIFSRSHKMVYGHPWAWERWDKKE